MRAVPHAPLAPPEVPPEQAANRAIPAGRTTASSARMPVQNREPATVRKLRAQFGMQYSSSLARSSSTASSRTLPRRTWSPSAAPRSRRSFGFVPASIPSCSGRSTRSERDRRREPRLRRRLGGSPPHAPRKVGAHGADGRDPHRRARPHPPAGLPHGRDGSLALRRAGRPVQRVHALPPLRPAEVGHPRRRNKPQEDHPRVTRVTAGRARVPMPGTPGPDTESGPPLAPPARPPP